jgi:hypothetical protein
MLPIGEAPERAGRIVADGRDAETLLPDCRQILCQFDELDLAERSPIRGAEED